MKHWRWTALAMVLPLANCDEPTVISHVDRRPDITMDQLWVMQDSRGIPVEIHGRPFRVSTDQELAEAIRPPGSVAQGVKFYSAPVGSWKGGHGYRLVLHFNPNGAPNSSRDCQRDEEAETGDRPESGYSVNLTFCKEDAWQATAFLKVLKSEERDFEAYADAIGTTFLAIFQDGDADER